MCAHRRERLGGPYTPSPSLPLDALEQVYKHEVLEEAPGQAARMPAENVDIPMTSPGPSQPHYYKGLMGKLGDSVRGKFTCHGQGWCAMLLSLKAKKTEGLQSEVE